MIPIDEMITHWNEDADNYGDIIRDELASFRVEAWQEIFRTYLPKGAKKVLDLGCGPGFFSLILADMGFEVTGIDCSSEMLKRAAENARLAGASIEFGNMDIAALPAAFPPESFDAIVSRNVTWTLSDPEKVYRDCRSLLKKGGMLAIFDANWNLPLYDEKLAAEADRRYKACLAEYGDAFESKVPIKDPIDLRKLPLSREKRPEWDKKVLSRLGFSVETPPDLTETIWSDKEKLLYGMTPLFGIFAVKKNP